jgi:hypothetical protein
MGALDLQEDAMSVSTAAYEAMGEKLFKMEQALKELERVTSILLAAAGEGGNLKAHRAIDLLPRKYVYEAREACAKARSLLPGTNT